jgi:hypothetical protein
LILHEVHFQDNHINLDFVNSYSLPKKHQFIGDVFLLLFLLIYILFDFVQDVHIQDLVDIVFTNSIIHVNEGSGVVNDNVHHTNFVVDQQRFGVAIANDLDLEKPHVDSIGDFQKKMMV